MGVAGIPVARSQSRLVLKHSLLTLFRIALNLGHDQPQTAATNPLGWVRLGVLADNLINIGNALAVAHV